MQSPTLSRRRQAHAAQVFAFYDRMRGRVCSVGPAYARPRVRPAGLSRYFSKRKPLKG